MQTISRPCFLYVHPLFTTLIFVSEPWPGGAPDHEHAFGLSVPQIHSLFTSPIFISEPWPGGAPNHACAGRRRIRQGVLWLMAWPHCGRKGGVIRTCAGPFVCLGGLPACPVALRLKMASNGLMAKKSSTSWCFGLSKKSICMAHACGMSDASSSTRL